MARDEGLSRTRRKVQQAVEQAEAEYRRQMLIKRIELASSGLKAFATGKHAEAVKNFKTYLHILEDWKGVGPGGLTPGLFDVQKDAAELLLMSGVYWDLVKLYDRTKSAEKQAEFLGYLEKYILFSKGMPFQALCAETLRKYLATEKPRHRDDFKNAYKMIAVHKCFVATALFDVTDPETIEFLRLFRDEKLSHSPVGRKFIDLYYRHGPRLAELTNRAPRPVRAALGRSLDLMAPWLAL